jgi:hypothetical protein
MTDHERAQALCECFDQHLFRLKTVEDCAEIGKGITYED